MKQVDRVLLGMELKVIAPSLMWKEAVLVVQYNIKIYLIPHMCHDMYNVYTNAVYIHTYKKRIRYRRKRGV